MKQDTYDSIYCWFEQFTEQHREEDGSFHYLPQLKIEHSKRVALDCVIIATELGWNPEDVLTAKATGILHDIARFPQFREYKSFLDHKTFNHGERGWKIASSEKVLKDCREHDKERILNGIRYHNRKELPDNLATESVPFVNLVRDADKIDIIFVINKTIKEGLHKEYPEILLNIDLDGDATPALIEEIRSTKNGSYNNIHSLIDMQLMRMTWIYDVNFLPSFKLMLDRHLLDDLTESIPDGPGIEDIKKETHDYLSTKKRLLQDSWNMA